VLAPKKLFRNLTFWVLISIIAGALVGHYWPERGVEAKVLSTRFIDVVKVFIYPIIFLTITTGISAMGDLRKVGRIGAKALLYFEIVTTFALLIGIIVAYIVQPGAGIPPQAGDVTEYTSQAHDFSWIEFFQENHTLQVLCCSIFVGMLLSQFKGKQPIIHLLARISHFVFQLLRFVMYFAPIGAFGGMAYTVGKFGFATLFVLAKLMICVYATMAIFIFLVLWLILRWYHISLNRFLHYIREELLVVLGTSSSEAALPTLMVKLETMGCARSVVGLVVPAGYSFNLDGTTIYLSMATIFLAQVYEVTLSWEQMVTVIGVLLVTSKGAAGITGAGFVVLASTLSAIQVIPVEGLAILLGVDRFMSEARAITNLIGNGVATIFLANHEMEFDRQAMHVAFGETNCSGDSASPDMHP
jgi:aerobic C4-dicarboxylate transport protein